MALLKDNKYIKLFEDGSFKIYESISARNKHKNAISSDIVFKKYDELVEDLDKELRTLVSSYGYPEDAVTKKELHDELMALPGVAEICKKIEEIDDEEYHYHNDLCEECGAKHDFPIVAKFFADVKDSIPNIIEKAGTFWNSTTLEEMYKEAKEKLRFGETEDC